MRRVRTIEYRAGRPESRNCRLLTQWMIKRAAERGLSGIRLLQAAFHSRSLSLCTKLGFVAREPLSVMDGLPLKQRAQSGCAVCPANKSDLESANKACHQIHSHSRAGELLEGIEQEKALTLMTIGLYNRPTGAYLTSILF